VFSVAPSACRGSTRRFAGQHRFIQRAAASSQPVIGTFSPGRTRSFVADMNGGKGSISPEPSAAMRARFFGLEPAEQTDDYAEVCRRAFSSKLANSVSG
jgi:hypothetical protein